jgi:hypothetical protein
MDMHAWQRRACRLIRTFVWRRQNANLEYHTGHQESDLRELTVLIRRMHEINLTSSLKTVRKKYDSAAHCHAARITVMREADMRFGDL